MSGYKGICINKGIFVSDEDALEYAMEHTTQEEREQMIIGWFFSSNWVRKLSCCECEEIIHNGEDYSDYNGAIVCEECDTAYRLRHFRKVC